MDRRLLLSSAAAWPLAASLARTRAVANAAPAAHGDAAATLAPLALATGWIGARPSATDLSGRVVLVDVFTFECINCVRVTPALKRLFAAYPRSELAVIGVHTPEVPSYQARLAYVAQQARAAALPWPIALDNAHRIWDAYGVTAWPTQLVFDRRGRLAATIVGDSQDAAVAAAVRTALRR